MFVFRFYVSTIVDWHNSRKYPPKLAVSVPYFRWLTLGSIAKYRTPKSYWLSHKKTEVPKVLVDSYGRKQGSIKSMRQYICTINVPLYSMNPSPKRHFIRHLSSDRYAVLILCQQGLEGPVVFVSWNRERALTGHWAWNRLIHLLIKNYLGTRFSSGRQLAVEVVGTELSEQVFIVKVPNE